MIIDCNLNSCYVILHSYTLVLKMREHLEMRLTDRELMNVLLVKSIMELHQNEILGRGNLN